MINYRKKFLASNAALLLSILILSVIPVLAYGLDINLNVNNLLSKAEVSLSPRAASFTEGATFEVPILLNTKGLNVNGIDIKINFDPDKLSIVKPSSGQSIIGVWVEPPSYDNTKGTASYVGVVPAGITTASGLIGTVTFKAKVPGKAVVSIRQSSKILLNDGSGTEAPVEFGRAEYTILPKAPLGVEVFSETHPFSGDWYNNNSPFLTWNKDQNVTGFSYTIDNNPSSIPPDEVMTEDTAVAYTSLADGLWYFHIKASKKGIWGNTSHFLIRIDTTPPADFVPKVDYMLAATASVLQSSVVRALISFFTTDNLSGVDYYEVGIINKSNPSTESPVFIQTESPFQTPAISPDGMQVIVRAVDRAGNTRSASAEVMKPFFVVEFIKENAIFILLGIIAFICVLMILHFIFRHYRHQNVS